MFRVLAQSAGRSGINRRELLRAGGLSLMGLTSAELDALRSAETNDEGVKQRRKNACVFLFLFGGPSQIDLWDMKPKAPAEVRGEFQPRSTAVPGIQICEHLPRLAAQMDKICLLRSMTHDMNVHGPACSELFSGREYFGAPTTDQATAQDWPSLAAMVMRYAEGSGGLPASVVLPWYLQFPGQARRIAGQTGGRMGEKFNPLLLQGNATSPGFQADGYHLRPELTLDRIRDRRKLLSRLHNSRTGNLATPDVHTYVEHRERAYSLIQGKAGELFDLQREPVRLREQYGNTPVGHSLLMARRLVESGVSLVTVNWQDETKIDGVNTCWDTHQNNFPKLKKLLCPLFDQAFPTFIKDLSDRGLLETTLVVAVGEFGRTPHMGQFSQSSNTRKSGRDHWPSAFTALLAGGGVRGGQVYGSTDHHAAQVRDRPVSPADLSATILHHLGVDFGRTYTDTMQQLQHHLSIGKPLKNLS